MADMKRYSAELDGTIAGVLILWAGKSLEQGERAGLNVVRDVRRATQLHDRSTLLRRRAHALNVSF